ncbi:MAG: AMP-binding protein [Acidimicrobiia bacterium]
MNTAVNLAELIEGHGDDHVALWSRGRPTTYGALRHQVASVRGGLLGLGVQPGDRVALVCGNDRSFVVSYLAVLGIGAVAVPLNPTDPGPALAREIEDVKPVVAVVAAAARGTWQTMDPASRSSVRSVVTVEWDDSDAIWFDSLVVSPPAPIVPVGPDAPALLMFTSGTAGAPRAAIVTHGNLRSNIDQNQAAGALTSADVVFGVLPLFHIFGLNAVLGIALAAGATVVLVQRFDPSTALETIIERGCTVVPGAPPMWGAWAQFHEADPDAFAGVRLALSGGARLPVETARAFEQRFSVPIREGYGLTEAAPVVTSSVQMDPVAGTIGTVLPGVEVRLVDLDGDDVDDGEPGEIWVRGPNVFAGYWNDPDGTARVLTGDGWLRTGDVAVRSADGRLSIVDRMKDLVIVSGFNVYPAEVEAVLAGHRDVAEVAVVGVPHPLTGEAVKAFVVAEPGSNVGEDTLIEYCGERLARYKCPSKVLFVDELPKALGGKLLRRELR